MKIGIVGSREFPQLKLVQWFINDLPKGVTVISGGARGVDGAAAEQARKNGLDVQMPSRLERVQRAARIHTTVF